MRGRRGAEGLGRPRQLSAGEQTAVGEPRAEAHGVQIAQNQCQGRTARRIREQGQGDSRRSARSNGSRKTGTGAFDVPPAGRTQTAPKAVALHPSRPHRQKCERTAFRSEENGASRRHAEAWRAPEVVAARTRRNTPSLIGSLRNRRLRAEVIRMCFGGDDVREGTTHAENTAQAGRGGARVCKALPGGGGGTRHLAAPEGRGVCYTP